MSRPRTCCGTRTSPCTAPRSGGARASRSSMSRCETGPTLVREWRRICGRHSGAKSSGSCSSLSWRSRPAGCTRSRPCYAGTTASGGSSCRTNSCRWPSRPVSSCRSAPGSCGDRDRPGVRVRGLATLAPRQAAGPLAARIPAAGRADRSHRVDRHLGPAEIETGRVYAFEALLRWHHGKRRVLLPHEFLPLAEQTGLIVSIGTWVLREACRYARTWQNAVPGAGPVRISVNVSAKQLADPRLIDDLRAALQDAGLTPAALSLEVTESVLMESLDSSIALLNRLREVGIQLHMDDFGSVYSSLSYLPRFPLQGIKVDRTFVHRMGARRTDLEIVRSIVDLAEHLGLIVIAEGVETATQRERLIAVGCELGQGFLFAKALEPEAARALLAEQRHQDPKAA